MRNQNIDQGWQFNHGTYEGLYSAPKEKENRIVNLPHDYMIESDPTESAAAGPASGYYTAGVACYTKYIMIPEEWENEEIYLHFDGVMLNATVDINGGKAALQHNGYIPFSVNITPYIYFGKKNRVTVTVNPAGIPVLESSGAWNYAIFRRFILPMTGFSATQKALIMTSRENRNMPIWRPLWKCKMRHWKTKLQWWRFSLPRMAAMRS